MPLVLAWEYVLLCRLFIAEDLITGPYPGVSQLGVADGHIDVALGY